MSESDETITLTRQECEAVHETIGYLSGHNPEYVFSHFSVGEPDDPADPTARAFAKIYRCAGEQVPPNLREIS